MPIVLWSRKRVLNTRLHAEAIVMHLSNGSIPSFASFLVRFMKRDLTSNRILRHIYIRSTIPKQLLLKVEVIMVMFVVPF